MPVNVTVQSIVTDYNKLTNEESFANILAERFRKELNSVKGASGEIVLFTNIEYGGGETNESDIFLVADLQGYTLHVTPDFSKTKVPVAIERGCWVIEIKKHSISDLTLVGNQLCVPYTNRYSHTTKYSPIQAQSRQQRFDIKNYLEGMIGYSPFIYNFLCLHSVSENDLENIILKGANNSKSLADVYLSKDCTFEQILRKTFIYFGGAVNYNPSRTNGKFNDCVKHDTMIADIKRQFSTERKVVGQLTQKKMNMLSLNEAGRVFSNSIAENKLNLFSGRAGTGKTIRLLQFAVNVENKGTKGNRCLVLTYNHALVSDIKRLLFLTGHHSTTENKTVDVSTLHSFFLEIMYQLEVRSSKKIDDVYSYYSKNGDYYKEMTALLKAVNSMTDEDLSVYKEIPECGMNWDYILIDEGQDWSETELSVIIKIYGVEHVVFADGVDQFIRSNQKIDLDKIIKKKKIKETKGNVCLRQNQNIVSFVNAFTYEADLDWAVKPLDTLSGGKVDIMKQYGSDFHIDLINYCSKLGAEPYDILFLVPYQDVDDRQINPHFYKYDLYKGTGIKLFDGTTPKNRFRYPIVGDECRLYQYDSCRGLEGWAVICYDFDLLVQNKMDEFDKEQLYDPDLGGSYREQKNNYAYLWSLMPLTRAVDRLIITLRDDQGEVAQLLKRVMNKPNFSDFVTWH